MEESDQRKFNFKRHTSPAVSRWYMLRITIYIVLLTAMGVILYKLGTQKPTEPVVHEVDNVSIELPSEQ